MTSFAALPSEIHNEIANHLPAFDVALLSLACWTLQQRLGRHNQRLWYNKFNGGIWSSKPAFRDGISPQERKQEVENWKASLRLFDPVVDYWNYATSMFVAATVRGCGRCFSQLDHKFQYVGFGPGDIVKRRYCQPCFEELFYRTDLVVELYPELRINSWVPQVRALLSSSAPLRGERTGEIFYIRKNVARKLVEQQIGPISKAKSQSSRFLANWMVRMRKIGEATDQSIAAIVDEYTNSFKRFHPIIEPSRLQHCIWKFIMEHQNPENRELDLSSQPESIPNNIYIPLPPDTRYVIRSIGDYLKNIDKDPEMVDACQDLVSMRASEYLVRLFGARDGEALDLVKIYHPEFLMDHIADWSKYVMPWMNAFSNAITGEYHHSETNDICCYWCLKKNPRNRLRYKRILTGAAIIPASSILFHLAQCHPDYIGRRPQDPHGDGWNYEYRDRGIPPNPSSWKYPLEDLPRESPDSLGYPNPMKRWTSYHLN